MNILPRAIRRPGARVPAWLVGLVLALAAPALLAAEKKPDEQKVAVTILGIHATNEKKPHVDPALKAITEQLKQYKFNCFRVVAKETRPVPLGKAWELALVEDYARRVTPKEITKDRIKMEIAWIQYVKDKDGKRKPHVRDRMVMSIGKGKYLLAGVKLKEGALIGAVAVE